MSFLAVGWLASLAGSFHLGWWGRWRMNQKLKKQAETQMADARLGGAHDTIIRGILKSYWEAL